MEGIQLHKHTQQLQFQVQAQLQHWKNSMTSLDGMREGETVCMMYLLKMAESIVKSLRLKSPLLHLVNIYAQFDNPLYDTT